MSGRDPIPGVQAYEGVRATNPPNVIKATRNPNSNDKKYAIGTLWVNTSGLDSFQLVGFSSGVPQWPSLGGGTVAVATLTGDSGGAISPSAGNINLLGTANQITTTGSGSTITWSLPVAITTPGSLTTTTSLTATTTVTAGTGITSTTGNIVATAGAVSAGTTVTGGTGVVATTGNVVATAGAVNAGTSMTATAGDITATLGNVIINGAAKQLQVHGGAATDFIGTSTLSSGITASIANTNIAATDQVYVSRYDKNGSTALGVFVVNITPSSGFTIEALKPADASRETNDVSKVSYFIVRQV